MLPTITALLVLQDRDLTLRELRRDLERIPGEIARAKSQMLAIETALEKAKAAVNENELAVRKQQLDVKTRRDTITRLHIQRFETRKNEEYTAMGHEIENYEAQIRALEDRELELMEEAETLKAKLKATQAEYAKTKQSVEEEIAAFGKRKVHEEARIQEVEADRQCAVAGVSDLATLELYERLLPRKFPPVVPIEVDDNCGGCHMRLTAGTATDVKTGKKLTTCDHCGRLVYMP